MRQRELHDASVWLKLSPTYRRHIERRMHSFHDTIARSDELDAALTRSIDDIRGEGMMSEEQKQDQSVASSKPAAKPRAGALFFALKDEIDASSRRLDEAAVPLMREMQETEELAHRAIEARRDKLAITRDYIRRVHDMAEDLAEGNGGPSLDGEASSESLTPAGSGAEQA